MNETELVKAIRAALGNLNELLNQASNMGIECEIRTYDATTCGDSAKRVMVAVEQFRRVIVL